jgi:hypothetical protein
MHCLSGPAGLCADAADQRRRPSATCFIATLGRGKETGGPQSSGAQVSRLKNESNSQCELSRLGPQPHEVMGQRDIESEGHSRVVLALAREVPLDHAGERREIENATAPSRG